MKATKVIFESAGREFSLSRGPSETLVLKVEDTLVQFWPISTSDQWADCYRAVPGALIDRGLMREEESIDDLRRAMTCLFC